MPKEQYEIVDMILIETAENNEKDINYRKQLELQCKMNNKRKDEMEVLVWATNEDSNQKYAHCNHVNEIITDHVNSVYFSRVIYKNNSEIECFCDMIESKDIIDHIPLYLIHFKRTPDDFNQSQSSKSLFIASSGNETSFTHSFHSYSQPLLSLKQSYGSFRNSKFKKNHQQKKKETKSWHELMKQKKKKKMGITPEKKKKKKKKKKKS